MITDAQKIDWYRRRVKALEGLLACYRASRQPSEKLFRELELTGQHVNHDGTWSGGDVPVESAPAAEATISFTRDLLDVLDKDGQRHDRGGRIWLDSAGEHEYTFHRNEASLKGFRHDVLIYQRVHRGKCYQTSPSECGGCECWCHGIGAERRCMKCEGVWPYHKLGCDVVAGHHPEVGAASVASADTTKEVDHD